MDTKPVAGVINRSAVQAATHIKHGSPEDFHCIIAATNERVSITYDTCTSKHLDTDIAVHSEDGTFYCWLNELKDALWLITL